MKKFNEDWIKYIKTNEKELIGKPFLLYFWNGAANVYFFNGKRFDKAQGRILYDFKPDAGSGLGFEVSLEHLDNVCNGWKKIDINEMMAYL